MHTMYAAADFVVIILVCLALITLADRLFKRFPKGGLKNTIQWQCRYARALSQDAFFPRLEQSLQDSLQKALSMADHIDDDGKATAKALTKTLSEIEATCARTSKAFQEIPGYRAPDRAYIYSIFM
jgi:hypothetical protein